MDIWRFLNYLLWTLILGAAVVQTWWPTVTVTTAKSRSAPQLQSSAEAEPAQRVDQRSALLARTLAPALARSNASVLLALLADAAARPVQHRYAQEGFGFCDPAAFDDEGLSLRDLSSLRHLTLREAETSKLDLSTLELGKGTTYGDHVLMTLLHLLPPPAPGTAPEDSVSRFRFLTFQEAWHNFQRVQSPEGRGRAAEIALKNLERGLKGRHAATLVGDMGAVSRLPGLLAVFVADSARALAMADPADPHGPEGLVRTQEELLGKAAQEITMVTHDRPEALVAAEFFSRVAFRLIFRELLLPTTPIWVNHQLDRPSMPSLLWRSVVSVQRDMAVPFLKRAVRDAERLCGRQQKRALLGGELGGARRLDPDGDLEDIGSHHTEHLPKPQSDDNKRELFGLSGGISAALPAILYLAWKYEKHSAAALTANTLLGGNAAARGVALGMLLGARAISGKAVPERWLGQLETSRRALDALSALAPNRALTFGSRLDYHPCEQMECITDSFHSDVTTSADVRIIAAPSGSVAIVDGRERRLLLEVNVSNTGASGLPVCPHGKIWVLWEAGGQARGRFRNVGGTAGLADRCLAPGQWLSFKMNVTTSEREAAWQQDQYLVGLLEVLRPVRGATAQRLRGPGAGNLVQAALVKGRPEDCEHFAAKIGRLKIPVEVAQ